MKLCITESYRMGQGMGDKARKVVGQWHYPLISLYSMVASRIKRLRCISKQNQSVLKQEG